MIIPLELIFVQIVGRHGNCTFIASDSFSFIVSYGYLFAGHVIIDNFSFANVEVFIAPASLRASMSSSATSSSPSPNAMRKKCDTDIETNHKWSA